MSFYSHILFKAKQKALYFIVCTVSGIVTLVSLLILSIASLGIAVVPSSKVTAKICELRKAPLSIFVIDFGIVMGFIAGQLAKALYPITLTELGIEMLASDEQVSNA